MRGLVCQKIAFTSPEGAALNHLLTQDPDATFESHTLLSSCTSPVIYNEAGVAKAPMAAKSLTQPQQ